MHSIFRKKQKPIEPFSWSEGKEHWWTIEQIWRTKKSPQKFLGSATSKVTRWWWEEWAGESFGAPPGKSCIHRDEVKMLKREKLCKVIPDLLWDRAFEEEVVVCLLFPLPYCREHIYWGCAMTASSRSPKLSRFYNHNVANIVATISNKSWQHRKLATFFVFLRCNAPWRAHGKGPHPGTTVRTIFRKTQ